MQESQYESTRAGSAPVRGGRPVTLAVRGTGAIISVGLVFSIIYWAVSLGQRDASQIPVIRAMEGAARIAPDDPGGTQAAYQGLAVNEVLAQDISEQVETDATLAPATPAIQPEDQAMSALQPVAPAPAAEPTRVDASSMLVEVNPDGTPVEPDPVAEPIVSDVAADGMVAPLRRPPSFYESDIINNLLLEVLPEEGDTSQEVPEPPRPTPPYGNPYLDPGDALVQLGAFNSLEDATAVWDRFQSENSDILAGLQRVIAPVEAGGRLLYQLRAAGLTDVDQARDICAALDTRGVDCIPLTQK